MISQVIREGEQLRRSIHKGTAINVNDRTTKDEALAFAKNYFELIQPRVPVELAIELDECIQQLVELSQNNNSRQSYLRVVTAILKKLKLLNVTLISKGSQSGLPVREEHSEDSSKILATLKSILPTAAAAYEQALVDLRDKNRRSYRGTAAELRKSLRETLDFLAPDEKVTAVPGFKLEKDQTKPTMKQKVRFILTSRDIGKTQQETTLKTLDFIADSAGTFTRAVYNDASIAAHVQRSREDVLRVKRYIETVFFDLLALH